MGEEKTRKNQKIPQKEDMVRYAGSRAADQAEKITGLCKEHGVSVPEIEVMKNLRGIRMLWDTEDGWHIEMHASGGSISMLACKDKKYGESMVCSFSSSTYAFRMVRYILKGTP